MHRRLPRVLSCALMASVPVLGVMAAFGPAAGASTVSSRAAQKAEAIAIARNWLQHLAIGQHATDHATGVSPNLSQARSSNWSGYADTSETFSSAGGSWTEPSGTCSGFTTSLAAFWVGIDGYSSGSVEQDGTLIECYFGTAYHFSWWEMYPTNAIQVVGQSVAAGDHITASVARSGTSYTLRVTDSTRPANSFSTTQSCSNCVNSSAEWIAEAPSGAAGIYPLTDFHTWTLSGATVSTTTSSGVISSYPDVEITMVGASDVKAQPGPLNSSGNGFSVTWEHST
ncbi:MAG TPA: G1 family glutamic endopeptidase [Streptosporangiaceae bacterium]|nr:G1 family glutamic endopeptidase [Streptosporangiaceae bacterium]